MNGHDAQEEGLAAAKRRPVCRHEDRPAAWHPLLPPCGRFGLFAHDSLARLVGPLAEVEWHADGWWSAVSLQGGRLNRLLPKYGDADEAMRAAEAAVGATRWRER